MDYILAETARRCIRAADGASGPLAADSSGVETTRYKNHGFDFKGNTFNADRGYDVTVLLFEVP